MQQCLLLGEKWIYNERATRLLSERPFDLGNYLDLHNCYIAEVLKLIHTGDHQGLKKHRQHIRCNKQCKEQCLTLDAAEQLRACTLQPVAVWQKQVESGARLC